MYGKAATEEQLAKAEAAIKKTDPEFRINRLSLEECDDFRRRLDNIWNREDNTFTRELKVAERRQLRSEIAVCRFDFDYWCSRYHFILDWEQNEFTRMNLNIAQRIMLDIFAEHEEKGIAIMLQILKARRLGITTLMEAVIEHRVMFHPNTRAIVGSADPDKSKKMVGMVEDSWSLIPFWMMPSKTQYQTGEKIVFGKLGSQLSIRHGAQKQTDVGRGETPTMAHISETCEWAHPELDIDAGLMFAMLPTAQTFLALESTAGVINDWWHKTWKFNRTHWGNEFSPSKLRPEFLPWYVGRDLYPTEADLRAKPIPSGWVPSYLTKEQARKAKEYVKATPTLRKHLGESWEMPIEQQWYWEYTRTYYKELGQLNIFLRELASNDIECFNSKYSSVFDAEVIEQFMHGTREPERIYMLDGPTDEIRPELKPDYREQDPDQKVITIDKRYQLVPIKKTGYPSHINPEGRIFIYELPQKEKIYGIGVDCAKGLGQDASAVEVIRKATMDEVPRQCAEFANSYVSANDLPPWCHVLARLYSVEVDGVVEQPKFAIETAAAGDSCLLALRKMGWMKHHNWVRYDKKVIDEGKAQYLGFVMVEWARDLVVGGMIKSLKDFMVDIDSPWLIEEMQNLEKNELKQRIEAALGAHDDRFFALGMILASMHAVDWSTLKSAFGKSRILQQAEEDKKNEPTYPRQPSGQSWAELAKKPAPDDVIGSEYDWEEYAKQKVEDFQSSAPYLKNYNW